MLLGIWKNVDELELSITLDELEAILEASREKEMSERRFQAALVGVDMDSHSAVDAQEKVEEMKRKVDAMNNGKTEDEFEFGELGLDIEIEE
jgi:hypothetical protein